MDNVTDNKNIDGGETILVSCNFSEPDHKDFASESSDDQSLSDREDTRNSCEHFKLYDSRRWKNLILHTTPKLCQIAAQNVITSRLKIRSHYGLYLKIFNQLKISNRN